MLILLPPSEGKNEGSHELVLSLAKLSFSKFLTDARVRALTESKLKAAKALTAPAIDIYSGVLYQALDYRSLSPRAMKRADREVVIISALFGALRPQDHIPSYKMKIKNSLWKASVSQALESLDADLVIDCRSSTYAGVWTPEASKTVAVRVFQEKKGKRSVITHMSKKYRGEFTRILLQSKKIKTPKQVKEIASRHFKAELHASKGKEPWYLDLIIKG